MGGALVDLAERQRARRRLPSQALDATIRSTPDSNADPVYVSIDAQPGYKRGPCYGWAPRYTVVQPDDPTPLQVTPVLPAPGDPCVVIETNGRALVILTWWPADA